MEKEHGRLNGDARVLHRNAVRTPLATIEAERLFHQNMMRVADAREQKAAMLADPNVSLLTAYETELDRVAKSFERRLERIAGPDYRAVAAAYGRGERDDRVGELTSYYLEALWRIQQRTTVTDMLFSPIIVRYPDSFTMNVRFASGYTTNESILYESPGHLTEDLDEEHAETYYIESSYSQQQAAEYIRDTAQIIREEFPDPDETPFEERKCGGIVMGGGRRGTTFSTLVQPVEPDPERFSEQVEVSTLVGEGKEARRTEDELFPEAEVVI
ncbi:hypothetical protein ACFQH2_06850 [Natronoarchaeum sp. GCM10025703]|uniref:hypothetical protein n=1 Tax=unclassified Natronoarchaeum TaxID=2620183 RepID=UPI003609DC0E